MCKIYMLILDTFFSTIFFMYMMQACMLYDNCDIADMLIIIFQKCHHLCVQNQLLLYVWWLLWHKMPITRHSKPLEEFHNFYPGIDI